MGELKRFGGNFKILKSKLGFDLRGKLKNNFKLINGGILNYF